MTPPVTPAATSQPQEAMDSRRVDGGKTGWPAGLLQEDSRELAQWFASRMDARQVIRLMWNLP